jgi:hypothetical protein
MRKRLRVESERPTLQCFQLRRAVRIPGRDEMDVSRAQHQVARVPDPALAARYEYDDRVGMDEGPRPGAAMLVTAVAAQPDRELVTLERFTPL